MFGKFVLWLCSVVFAFSLGARSTSPEATDSELEQRVREHMDVIVDEAAGIADDISEEIRKDERVQQAGEFVDSVKEIVRNTQADIEDHFGQKTEDPGEEAASEVPAEEAAEESGESVEESEESVGEPVGESQRSDG